MYNSVIETANKLKEQRKELSDKRESQDRTLSQTDLINKTNVEVAKHLVRFMHEYMTSIEVKNLPENLAKTDDINSLVSSLEETVSLQSSSSQEIANKITEGISGLLEAIRELKEVSEDKSEDSEYTEKVCEGLRSVQAAITKANTAVLKGDKTKDVVSAVKALEKAVKGLRMAPVVNVAPAKVDLSGIEKKIAEIPGKIKIPQTVIPENDYTALEQAIHDVQSSIENMVFPVAEFPTTVKVTNTDGSAIAGGSTKYVTRIDEASATVTYIGKAVPDGSTVPTSEASWQITKIDESSGTVITYADGDLLFNNVWDNRVGLAYA